MTLTEASEHFLAHCQSAITLSAHTLRAYKSDLADCAAFFGAGKILAQMRKEQLRGYIAHMRNERSLKESTIKRKLATLKLFLKWAIHERKLRSNPFDSLNERIRLPKRLPRALDRSDRTRLQKEILPVFDEGDFDLMRKRVSIQLLLETGIRVGELVSISCGDVSLSDKSIVIHGKGNRQRLIYLTGRSLQRSIAGYLRRRTLLPAGHERLFITSAGLPLSTASVRRDLRGVANGAGLSKHVTPHMLRHTCATFWLESGLDIRFVQKLLGHHSISTTEIYTHVSDQGLRNALQRVHRQKAA